ncbi:MAG: DUF2461 domain-containing protein [Bacteroidetes bacterium]|nr:DUF2461 domain-containing protein [Bacteroidota bacterium]MDA1119578.1 DUF2461 domain-containing protein [Bacteroidota bacterium]
MAYFTSNFSDFFNDLSNNNNTDWFHANKKSYEKNVKDPFINFLTDLIDALHDIEGPIPHDAKGAMMRINKDIRFSKDKTPYKTQMSAIISAHGKKNMRLPGMYIQINNDDAGHTAAAICLKRMISKMSGCI